MKKYLRSEEVHPSHEVYEQDTIGIASDPCCEKCGASVYDSPETLIAPCKAKEIKSEERNR